MPKVVTDNQVLGELGETAIKKIVLEAGFIYDNRGRLEAGTDGLIELRDPRSGAPLGEMLAVQVKSTDSSQYVRENSNGFEYVLKSEDLKYWRTSNIPVVIILWRKSDQTAYWKDVTECVNGEPRRLKFDKRADVFDASCGDRLGALTIDRRTPGVFLPPLNQGEGAIINLLRIKLPEQMFTATSPFGGGRDAIPELIKQTDIRFDWVIRKRRFLSFFDPREFGTRSIVDSDQVETHDTEIFALSDETDDVNDLSELLRRTVERQTKEHLSYLPKDRLFYFKATGVRKARNYRYMANINETSARVVSVYLSGKKGGRDYVRHHAARFRFERLADEWFIVVDPDYYFTYDGLQQHRYPEALLAGKKRLERNAAVRGQVMMWQHLLVNTGSNESHLFDKGGQIPSLQFEQLPILQLSQAVPEASWSRTDPRSQDMEARDLFEGLDPS